MAALPLHQPSRAEDTLGPRDRHEATRWLVIAGVGFVLGAAFELILLSIAAGVAGTKGGVTALANAKVPPAWFVVVGFVGLWIGLGGAAFVATRSGRRIGVTFRRHDVLYVFLGLVLQVFLDAIYSVGGANSKGLSQSANHLLGGGPGWVLVVPGAMAVLFAPFFEELFFRGVLLRSLLVVFQTPVAVVGVTLSVLADASLFGVAHLGTDEWIQLPGLAFVGVVLCVLAIRSRRLGPSIVTHASFNALAVLAFAWSR